VREVAFTYLHPVGPELEGQNAPLAEFLGYMPHLFYFRYMPSLNVLNGFLAAGLDEAGMGGGCRWEPFQLTSLEYDELVQFLRVTTSRVGRHPDKFVAVPDEIRTKNQWFAWVWSVDLGQPYDESMVHLERIDSLAQRRDSANANGNAELAESLHLEWFRAGESFRLFMEQYDRPRGK
jgi:hypothetical protein